MELVFHGGKCCGIKTIYGFGTRPNAQVSAKKETYHANPDKNGHHVGSNTPFYMPEAPQETALERLKRYLAYCDEHRPDGIVEVTLAQHPSYTVKGEYNYDAGYGLNQKQHWHDVLIEHGFRLLNENRNSNSGNTVYVYHRNSNCSTSTKQKSLRGDADTLDAAGPEAAVADVDVDPPLF